MALDGVDGASETKINSFSSVCTFRVINCFLKESLSDFGAPYLDLKRLCSSYGPILWLWTVFTP